MITSIRHGLKALGKGVEAFFIVLGDQPGIPSSIYGRLIREFRRDHPNDLLLIEMDSMAILEDIDTPEGYRNLVHRKSPGEKG